MHGVSDVPKDIYLTTSPPPYLWTDLFFGTKTQLSGFRKTTAGCPSAVFPYLFWRPGRTNEKKGVPQSSFFSFFPALFRSVQLLIDTAEELVESNYDS